MSRYGQPQRTLRRRAADAQVAREYASYFGDGEFILNRILESLQREYARTDDRVRREALRGAFAVVRAAHRRVITANDGPVPF